MRAWMCECRGVCFLVHVWDCVHVRVRVVVACWVVGGMFMRVEAMVMCMV